MLLKSKALTGDALDAISLHREFGIFFGNHQAQARIGLVIGCGQEKYLGAGHLEAGVVKNRFEVRGA